MSEKNLQLYLDTLLAVNFLTTEEYQDLANTQLSDYLGCRLIGNPLIAMNIPSYFASRYCFDTDTPDLPLVACLRIKQVENTVQVTMEIDTYEGTKILTGEVSNYMFTFDSKFNQAATNLEVTPDTTVFSRQRLR